MAALEPTAAPTQMIDSKRRNTHVKARTAIVRMQRAPCWDLGDPRLGHDRSGAVGSDSSWIKICYSRLTMSGIEVYPRMAVIVVCRTDRLVAGARRPSHVCCNVTAHMVM